MKSKTLQVSTCKDLCQSFDHCSIRYFTRIIQSGVALVSNLFRQNQQFFGWVDYLKCNEAGQVADVIGVLVSYPFLQDSTTWWISATGS